MDLGEPQRTYILEPRELPVPLALPAEAPSAPVPSPAPELEPAEASA
jgi:hypothetical protein